MHDTSIPQIPASKQIVIERLDVEIRSLTERLCLLKSERNSLSNTYTLPPEILAEIFTIVQEECGYSNSEPRRGMFVQCTWLSMTCVSRHWRQVAIECPQLWCDIRVGTLPPPTIQMFLARSGGRNLYVSVDPAPRRQAGRQWIEYADLFAQTSRIERLNVSLEKKTFFRTLSRVFFAQVPNLRSFSISGSGDIVVSDDIFQATVPHLHSLSLYQCQFTVNSPLLTSNLTTLIVSYCRMGSTTLWLNVLQRMPRLEYLSLTSSFLGDTYVPISKDFGIVTLLRLSTLVIQGFIFDSDLDFLSHLTFPCQTAVVFSSTARSLPLAHDAPPLAAFLQVHRNACRVDDTPQTNITTLNLKFEGSWEELDHPEWASNMIQFGAGTDGSQQNYLRFNITTTGQNPELWKDVPMAEITLLPVTLATSFTTNFEIKQDNWEILSDRCPHLQEIEVSGMAVRPLLLALGAGDINSIDPNEEWRALDTYFGGMEGVTSSVGRPEDDAIDFTHDVNDTAAVRESHRLFPSLKSIRMFHIALHQHKEDIINALSVRRIKGLPIERVQLNNWVRDDEFLFDLKGLVQVVDYTSQSHGWD
ncbi:hypothetical protein BDN72DRAFT_850282 [Pluteus cervinus]|uniref:Uncharacterized protein n=1 Tax=Pluteus cervinus TaxID=181527 RepID=A0ACD3A4Z9_9AGAR|nr:hypothetical protein BDN72DRAFT_850282 [Pluteus cervinus]